jgi:signal transduction histidine kinase
MKSRDFETCLKERQASHDILEINEEELCRIILDIHDGPVQNMYAALSQINTLQGKLATRETASLDSEAISRSLTQIAGLLESSLSEIKNFIGTFRPPEFQKRDLLPVLKGLLIQHENLTGSRIEMQVTEPLPSVSVPVKIALYRILQEALSNAYRHAGTDRQYVRLFARDNGICMEVIDEGAGFDPAHVFDQSEMERPSHIGLRGMHNRVELLGGQFHLESSPGHGTRLSVWVPCYDEYEQCCG